MDIWKFIQDSPEPVALLYVTASNGSSPGRKGFKMAIRRSGELCGSIGGGIMEQRLVETAREKLDSGDHKPILKRQIHRRGKGEDYSGLICSGEQTVAMVIIAPGELTELDREDGFLVLSVDGVRFSSMKPRGEFWTVEPVGRRDTVYIIGGGHVGLALSRTMSQVGFRVEVFDDRAGLNTIAENNYADSTRLGPLRETLGCIPEGPHIYVVAVTFGVAMDRIVLEQLSGRKFRYFGMMGSEAKLRELKKEFGPLEGIHAPIGLPIKSHSPEEIAISIAAEIIAVKNSVI